VGRLSSNLHRVIPAYLTLFVWNVAWGMSINGPVLPLYVESLGISVIGWSVLAAAFAVGMFLLEWVWGSLCDRTDRRLLMISSVLCMSVIFALYTLHSLVPLFIVLQLLSGAVGVIIGPTTRVYVTHDSPDKSIGLYASVWWAFHNLGRVVGPLLGTYIAQSWSFEYSFYTSSALSIALAFIIMVSFPSDKKRQRAGNPSSIMRGLKVVLAQRSARLLLLSAVFSFMGLSVMRSFLPLYAAEQIKMSTVDVGVLFASVWGAQLFAMPLLGWVSDRFGKKRTVFLGFVLSSCLFLLYFLAGTSYQLLLVSVAVGVGLSGTSLLLAMVPDVAPNRMYGATVGVYGSFEDLGSITGPLIFGFVWSAFGPVFIFAASSITQLLGAVLILAIEQQRSIHTRSIGESSRRIGVASTSGNTCHGK
jgi:DHA1 family multidrug resistance protein-like MFS transporter